MRVALLSILLTLLQFFQSGDLMARIDNFGDVHFATNASHHWNKSVPDHTLDWVADVEDSEESNSPAFGPVSFIVPTNEAYRPEPFLKQPTRRFQPYRARSAIGEDPLFLIYRNFRV